MQNAMRIFFKYEIRANGDLGCRALERGIILVVFVEAKFSVKDLAAVVFCMRIFLCVSKKVFLCFLSISAWFCRLNKLLLAVFTNAVCF